MGTPTAIVDPASDTLFLFMNPQHGGRDAHDGRRVLLLTSVDGGVSWSEPRDMTSDLVPSEWDNVWMGTQQGITVDMGAGKQRLIMCANHHSKTGSSGAHTVYSDDHGATWQNGKTLSHPASLGECSLAQTSPAGPVTMYARVVYDDHTITKPRRSLAVSSDFGASFNEGSTTSFPGNPSADAEGAFVGHANKFLVGSAWGQVSPQNPGRHNYTVLVSDAVDGKPSTWTPLPAANPLSPGIEAEYSTILVPTADKGATFFVVYERGDIYQQGVGPRSSLRLTQLRFPVNMNTTATTADTAPAALQQPSICLNETGFAFVSAAGCRAGATPYRHTGADAFNILWSVWSPTQAPHPPHIGNWSTSAATLEQMAAAKLPFARVFGSPWGWEQIALWRSDTEQYWANMTRVVDKAKAVGARLHLSITPTLSQFAIAAGCPSTRELITNEGGSGCREVLKQYVQDMVGRFKDDATILSWGMGNELNLEADGCSYNKSRGEYFSTAEMMAFSTLYVSWVKELDPLRPMGSDMGQARTRARHLSALKGGGAACVNAHNPKGDCEVNCSVVPKDSLADFKQITRILSEPFDMVSVHNYGCYPPFAEFSFCNGDNTSIATLQAAKEVADEMGKPLFVGEFGSPACNVAGGAGWESDECLAFPRKLLDYQVKSGIQLSNAWTWCQASASGWCINDGQGAQRILALLQTADKRLNGGHGGHASFLPSLATDGEHGTVGAAPAPAPPPPLQMHWLGEETEARCMDGSRYGYYFRPASSASAAKKWVIELQGGGWCYNEGACYGRTLPSYGNGVFGSSKNWTSSFGTYYLDNQDWNRVFLRYCSGASFTGYRKEGWDASGWQIPGHTPPNNRVPNGTKLWFRGAANLADSIADLQAKHGMEDVDELVLTGSSAGGLATTLNLDRVKELVQPQRIAGLSDAGFFKYESNHSTPRWSGSANFSADMQHLFGMVNASGSLSAKCQAAQTAHGSAVPAVGGKEIPAPGPWNCLVAATAEQYVESPLFFLQSRFDHFQLGAELALQCMVKQSYSPPWQDANCSAEEVGGMKEYAADLHAELSRVISQSSSRGIFLSSCIIHGQSNLNAWTKTKIAGVTPQQAWREWYGGLGANEPSVTTKWVEECADGLPCNPNTLSCAPYT